jgi:hypothetical protein
MTIEIICGKSRSPSTFHAVLASTGERLCSSRTPFYSAARVLQKRGVKPETQLIMKHQHSDTVAMRSTVGAAAKLTIHEGPNGPVIAQWSPMLKWNDNKE